MPDRIEKDPIANLDYGVDWSPDIRPGDEIQTSVWSAEPAGVTITNETHTADQTVVWVSGGTPGETYRLRNRIVTTGGRTDQRTVTIDVKER